MKKTISIILTIMLVLCAAGAALAATPSKTSEDVAVVKELWLVDKDGKETKAPSDLSIILVENQMADDMLDKIEEFVKDKPVGEFFPKKIQKTYEDSVDTVEMNELSGLKVTGYKASYGDVAAKILFDTPYEEDQDIFPAVGYYDAKGALQWDTLKVIKVEDDGALKLLFDGSLLEKLNNATAIIAILDNPVD